MRDTPHPEGRQNGRGRDEWPRKNRREPLPECAVRALFSEQRSLSVRAPESPAPLLQQLSGKKMLN